MRHNKLDAEAKATVRAIGALNVSGRLLISTPDSDRGDEPSTAEGGRSKAGGGAAKTVRPKATGLGTVIGGVKTAGAAGVMAAMAKPAVPRSKTSRPTK